MNISELLKCRLQNNRLLLFESIRDNGSERGGSKKVIIDYAKGVL